MNRTVYGFITIFFIMSVGCEQKVNVSGDTPAKRDFIGQWYEGDENIDWNAPVNGEFRSLIIERNGSFSEMLSVNTEDEQVHASSFGTYKIDGEKIILMYQGGDERDEYIYKKVGKYEYLTQDDKVIFKKFKMSMVIGG